MFTNRMEGGNQLADLLLKYKDTRNSIVIGLPRGGVVTAYAVAKKLHLPLDVMCPRKIGAPFNPEYAIGAISETGECELDEKVVSEVPIPEDYLQLQIKKEQGIAQNRLKSFRPVMPPRNLSQKTVIIVDDGLATGSTMKAAIKTARKEQAEKVVVAVPVSPQETYYEMQRLADEVLAVILPSNFYAVGQFYDEFNQTSDEEVIHLMKLANRS